MLTAETNTMTGMNISVTELLITVAALLMIGMGGVAVAVVAWTMISGGALARTTCSQCGGQLPVAGRPVPSAVPACGDWTCNRCGTRFDSRGKARNQPV